MSDSSLLRRILDRAEGEPDRVAVSLFSKEKALGGRKFGEIVESAGRAASFLRSRGLGVGDVVALIGTHHLDLYAAWIGALWVGAIPTILPEPSVRIDRGVYWSRLTAIIARSGIAALLVDPSVDIGGDSVCGIPRFAYDGVAAGDGPTPSPVAAREDDVLLLQHSSGTTGLQKGVMLTHGMLLRHADRYAARLELTRDDTVATWLPLYHDFGLIGAFSTPLIVGSRVVWLSPFEWIARPELLLEAIAEHRATVTNFPNFAFLVLSRIPRTAGAFDLSSLRAVVQGGEPTTLAAMDAFVERFRDDGLRREAIHVGYGMAESVMMVTHTARTDPPRVHRIEKAAWQRHHRAVPAAPEASPNETLTHVSCGACLDDCSVRIVDEAGRELPIRAAGRVLVRSPYLFAGYYKERERDTPSGDRGGSLFDADGFFDSGDVGYLDEDGHLVVTGRIKDIIIVAGRNVYPQDIEAVVGEVPGIHRGRVACFGVRIDSQGTDGVVVVAESDEALSGWPALEGVVRRSVSKQADVDLVDVHVVARDLLVRKSTAGKLARESNREWYLEGRFGPVPAFIGGMPPASEERSPPDVALDGPRGGDLLGVRSAVEDQVRGIVARLLRVPPADVDPARPLMDLGLSSWMMGLLRGELERATGRPFGSTLAFSHPTVRALAARVAEAHGVERPASMAASTSEHVARARSTSPRGPFEPIAVIGLGCRFPSACGPEAFWELLRDGGDAVSVPSAERRRSRGAAGSEGERGGFLARVDEFDADFFGISPREARIMDPQQRLLLEVTWEALEHAGVAPRSLAGTATSVFVGVGSSEYGELTSSPGDDAGYGLQRVTGRASSLASNRISYALDLRGPSVSVDSACSSSLVAVDLACRSLRAGESDVALAGGVSLLLLSETTRSLSDVLSSDARCKTFDAAADGYVRGEGCGVVVLKRLSDAVAAGDRVLAVIAGSAVTQNGRGAGQTAPSVSAQESAIRRALLSAGVEPRAVAYVEAHGTGTRLGDAVEWEALSRVFGPDRSDDAPLVVGSVKTNIGHLEWAAGVAGLVKVVLSLQHDAIPRHLHFERFNPEMTPFVLPSVIPRALTPWATGAAGGERIAGVSSSGFGGTNAHVVVKEPPREDRDAWAAADALSAKGGAEVLSVSAATTAGLRAQAERYAEYLSRPREAPLAWRDVAYTSCVRRTQLEHRLVVTGSSALECAARLRDFARGESVEGLIAGRAKEWSPRAVFVFPGQGSQWRGMGCGLAATEPSFAAHLARCDEAFAPYVTWRILEKLDAERWTIDEVQPLLFAVQTGIVEVLRSRGVEAHVVLGHSMGEVAAAYASGALTLDDAARVICERSRLLRRVSGRGSMALVELALAEAEAELESTGGAVSVAASNGPRSTVLAGRADALHSLVERLQDRGVFCRVIHVDVASHSSQVDELEGDLVAALAALAPREAKAVRFVSTVTANGRAPALAAAYWWRNLRDPVRLAQRVADLVEEGYGPFIEVSPHPSLTASIDEIVTARGKDALVTGTLRREEPEREAILRTLAALHATGHPVDWNAHFTPRGRVVSLPSYPWKRDIHWIDDRRPRGERDTWISPLLQRHVEASDAPGRHTFEAEIDLANEALAYLGEHRVQGNTWVPGAAYVEMVLEAARTAFGPRAVCVEDLTFAEALTLREGAPARVQLVVHPEVDRVCPFTVAARPSSESTSAWTMHATGRLRLGGSPPETDASLRELQARCLEPVTGQALYDAFAGAGLDHGETFRRIEQAWRGKDEALARLTEMAPSSHIAHPALLDAAFQIAACIPGAIGSDERAYVPASIERVRVRGRVSEARWAHASLRSATARAVDVDIHAFDAAGRPVLDAHGLRLVPLGRAADPLDRWLFEVQWRALPRITATTARGTWLVLEDQGGIGSSVRRWLEERGARVVSIASGPDFIRSDASRRSLEPLRPESFRRLLDDAFGASPPEKIVHLWGLDVRDAGTELSEEVVARAEDRLCTSTLHLVQAVAAMGWGDPPNLVVVTRGCQPAAGSRDVVFPEQALAWGFGATVMHELSELRTKLVDLDPSAVSIELLAQELASGDGEDRVALRGGERMAPRLVRHVRAPLSTGAARRLSVGVEGYRVIASRPGDIDSLTLEPCPRPSARAGEVVIATRASGVNFRDVLVTLGVAVGQEGTPMGFECAGVVVDVGEGVDCPSIGDEVIAIAPGAFDAFVRAPATLVVTKPAAMSFERAASVAAAYTTALHALERVGRLARGERVLVHAATGGVGLAAVHYAGHVGAHVFATAGTEEKRAYLRSLGVEHVYDSRSLEWADAVMRDTEGRGVDVVLNSLAGEGLARGLGVLAPHGRFIELGKRDVYANSPVGLYAMRNNVTLSTVAIELLAAQRPDELRALLVRTLRMLDEGALKPLPIESFPVSRAADALQHLARARHIGKVVLTSQESVTVRDEDASARLRADRTYLVTGGLGGLGLVAARRLVKLGAGHVALLGRRPPSEAARAAIAALERTARVHVLRGDVANEAELEAALAGLRGAAPPVAGVVHAAGVLDDATLSSLSAPRIGPVLAPKVLGALWLDRLLPKLDFFVSFASAAGLLGSAGQAHYAAANAFLDAFAHDRARRDEPALSLDWGAWAEVGLAARADRADNVTRQGLATLTPEQGGEMFERALTSPLRQLAPLPVDLRQWRQANPRVAAMPFLTELAPSTARPRHEAETAIGARVRAAASELERVAVLEEYVRSAIAHVLRARVDAVARTRALKDLGFDSLMTVSLKNTLERDLDLSLSTATLFAHPTVQRLALLLSSRLRRSPAIAPAPTSDASNVAAETTPIGAARVDALSDDEVSAQLAKRIGLLARPAGS